MRKGMHIAFVFALLYVLAAIVRGAADPLVLVVLLLLYAAIASR